MTRIDPGRPAADEHIPYYAQYIARVPDGNILDILAHQIEATLAVLPSVAPERARERLVSDGWSVVETVGHLADTERILSYRALRFARGDRTPLTGVDFDPYVVAGGFAGRPFAEVIEEFASVRRATMTLLRGLDAAAWDRSGLADGNPISVRALAYALAGHELAHIGELRVAFGTPVATA